VTARKTIGPEDFVGDAALLSHIVALLEQNSRVVAQKAEEWQEEARLHETLLDTMTPTTTSTSSRGSPTAAASLVSGEVFRSNFDR
jgi:hypothetical protein